MGADACKHALSVPSLSKLKTKISQNNKMKNFGYNNKDKKLKFHILYYIV